MCKIKDTKGKAVCESGDEEALTNIVKDIFIEEQSQHEYNFKNNPPILNGQTGVPHVVDQILGNRTISCFSIKQLLENYKIPVSNIYYQC